MNFRRAFQELSIYVVIFKRILRKIPQIFFIELTEYTPNICLVAVITYFQSFSLVAIVAGEIFSEEFTK